MICCSICECIVKMFFMHVPIKSKEIRETSADGILINHFKLINLSTVWSKDTDSSCMTN